MKEIKLLRLTVVDNDDKTHYLEHEHTQGPIAALRDIAVFFGSALGGVPETKVDALLTEESVALTNKAAAISSDSPHPTVLDFGRTIKR